MALDRVISNWAPGSNLAMKRITSATAGSTISLDLGRESVLSAMDVGTSSPVLQVGTLDALVAGGFDIPSWFGGKGQRSAAQKVKTPERLTGS